MKDPQNQKNEARSFTPGKNNYVTQNESPRLVPFESQQNTFDIQPKCTPLTGEGQGEGDANGSSFKVKYSIPKKRIETV